ncbi:MAG TPA: hypothetical protein VHZ27_10800, partial [Solirubrobacteraceae bacterium]|nr:hypothetical protein [Solirubrobacteraceae bacterium]
DDRGRKGKEADAVVPVRRPELRAPALGLVLGPLRFLGFGRVRFARSFAYAARSLSRLAGSGCVWARPLLPHQR